MKQELNTLKNEQNESVAATDEINLIVGPGAILKEARETRGLSEQQVADKLNFRLRLVQNIEVDIFDRSLPEAFNRGYLKSYAKLVNIPETVVLNSYDQLAEVQNQCAGMQSFSKGTEKQAEHKLLMWITYLILAIFLTATVVWWLQTPSEQPEPIEAESANLVAKASATNETNKNIPTTTNAITNESNLDDSGVTENNAVSEGETFDVNDELNTSTENATNTETVNIETEQLDNGVSSAIPSETVESANVESITDESITAESETSLIANVVFTFSGDCWVNIYDATGERIAWGVKKSGYVMKISGQAPFSITLGKPELVAIDYNDLAVDMTGFNAGNIAKFSLPMTP
jgi:cytoskeleton protein RodZ